MAVDPRSVKIQSPCPTDLDPNRHKDGKTSWYCGHCEKSVHILSNMTEREARKLMSDKAGEKLCISYAIRPDGKVRFLPEPVAAPPASNVVPVTALTSRKRVAAAAAVGFSAALAACTPHDNPDVRPSQDPPVVIERVEEMPAGGMMAEPIEAVEPIEDGEVAVPVDDPMVDGGMKAMPIDEPIVDGEIEPAAVDEPCDTSKSPPADDTPHVRGEMAAQVPDEEEALGNAIAKPITPDSIPKPGGMVARPLPPE